MPIAWATAGFGVAYLPFAFQRKMIMGTHVPLCLLAALAVAGLAARFFPEEIEIAKTRKGENAKFRSEWVGSVSPGTCSRSV